MVWFRALASGQPWFTHLQRHLELDMFLPQAWLGLFASWLPFPTLVQCLENLEKSGFAGMLALTLAILDDAGPTISKESGMEGLLRVLGDLRGRAETPTADKLKQATMEWLPAVYSQMAGCSPGVAVPREGVVSVSRGSLASKSRTFQKPSRAECPSRCKNNHSSGFSLYQDLDQFLCEDSFAAEGFQLQRLEQFIFV
jgi:hypothetical protein